MRRTTTVTVSAAITAVTLLTGLTGCGQQPTNSGVATVDQGTAKSEPTAKASPTLSDHQRSVKFAQCLREHGIEVSDPGEGKGVRMKSRASQEKITKAMDECREFAPPGMADGKPDPKMQESMRQFAKCMRAEGIDIPDPKPDEMGMRLPKGVMENPKFEAAQEKCGKLMGGRLGRKAP